MKHAKLKQSIVALMLVAAGGLAHAGGGDNGLGWNGASLNGWGQNGKSFNGKNLNGKNLNGLRGNDAARSSDFMTVDSPVRSTVHSGSARPAPALSAERIAE